jgi:hypothetical protein
MFCGREPGITHDFTLADACFRCSSRPLKSSALCLMERAAPRPSPVVPATADDGEGHRRSSAKDRCSILWRSHIRAGGILELDLRITLETDDHALIYMTFQGLRHGPPDVIAAFSRGEVVDPARYYFRTVPRFDTSAEAYAFLNRIVTVGVGETRPDGALHRIDEIL